MPPTPLQRLERHLAERMVKAMATFGLIDDDDRILVGLSGGKDSLCLLELLARRQRIQHPRFELGALHVRMANIHYESDTSYLQQFAARLGVELHVVTTSFDASTDTRKTPCFLCSWYRRKAMFDFAQAHGYNKIALGHHQDDILHTTLMGLMFQGQFGSMPAFLQMRKMPLALIRPLCMIAETKIREYAEMRHYEKQKKSCPYETSSHRTTAKTLFEEIESIHPEARANIWRALMNEGKLTEKT